MPHPILPTLLLLLLTHPPTPAHGAGTAPCHSNRRTQGEGSACEVISVPKGLCNACKLNPLLARGNFMSCMQIYNLTPPKCRKQLRKYARLNPCDALRNAQVRDFSNQLNLRGLDYFVYSVCEECCDCIPRGTKDGEYDQRKAAGTLIKVDRANCGTHLHFDVCKVWPQVRYVKRPRQKVPAALEAKWPKICLIVKDWKENFNGPLFNVDEAAMPKTMKDFLSQYTNAVPCKQRRVWQECYRLESMQRRL